MRNKIVLWGANAADERILVALELKIEENKVMVYTFPEKIATDEFYQSLMDTWRNDQGEVVFPEGHQAIPRELSISESILPDDVKVERSDVVQRAQTEWHFVVLSSKLSTAYHNELKELEEKLAGLKEYDKEVWNNLKQFWGKVQQQAQDRTLLREHADNLRDRVNKGFEELKTLRSKLDDEFRKVSKENMDRFGEIMDDVENRIKENKHLTKMFDELKTIQKNLREVNFTREHRNKLWQRIDSAFKEVKEKRFGDKQGAPVANSGDNSSLQRINSRFSGLLNAIEKMERSIGRDEEDLEFQQLKINRTDGQLEAQIRQAKIQMIEQRVSSKREKLDEMLQTKIQLEAKIEKEKERNAKREAQREMEAARRIAQEKAKEKIAEDIRKQQETLAEESGELASAAQAINEQKTKSKPAKVKPEAVAAEEPAEEAPAEATEQEAPAPKVKPEAVAAEEPATKATPAEPTADEAPAPKTKAPAEESLLGAIGLTISESLEDVMDTVKAVAAVVGKQIEEKVDELKEEFNEAMHEEEE
jgi:hypothetical protein